MGLPCALINTSEDCQTETFYMPDEVQPAEQCQNNKANLYLQL